MDPNMLDVGNAGAVARLLMGVGALLPSVRFETPFADRWNRAARTLGIDISSLPTDAGHA